MKVLGNVVCQKAWAGCVVFNFWGRGGLGLKSTAEIHDDPFQPGDRIPKVGADRSSNLAILATKYGAIWVS